MEKQIIELIRKVFVEVLKIYESGDFGLEIKSDNSPLTLADKKASDMICEKLKELTPEIPIICEETKNEDYNTRKKWTKVWLVDPIDGTKEFVKKTGEFTVNIGLIENGIPIKGFVGIPTKNIIYYGTEKGSFKISYYDKINITTRINVNNFNFTQDNIKIVASKSHYNKETDEFVKQHKNAQLLNFGSSIKFLMIAEGIADYYPRVAPTYEWDTCASHAIVNYAGGRIYNLNDGKDLVYNKENLLNPNFICIGKLKN